MRTRRHLQLLEFLCHGEQHPGGRLGCVRVQMVKPRAIAALELEKHIVVLSRILSNYLLFRPGIDLCPILAAQDKLQVATAKLKRF